MEKVQILLSTFNGEKYLKEQLDSILNQDYSNYDVLIRDDGSNDGTVRILEEYSSENKIKVIFGKNKGVVNSFFELIKKSDVESEYFSFCDQDDVWLPDKISRAVEKLIKYDMSFPALYCSRQILVNEKLRRIGFTKKPCYKVSFNNALVQNIAAGCTLVFNQDARNIIFKKIPDNAVMHDWWLYLLVSAFGNVYYDNESRILYRQHSGNEMGYKKNPINKWRSRLKRFFKNNVQVMARKQAYEFYYIYAKDLGLNNRKIIEKYLFSKNIFERISFCIKRDIYMQSRLDDFILKILIVLNKV